MQPVSRHVHTSFREGGAALLTSKCPLRRTKVLEQSTMRQMTTCRTTPVTEAVPFTQPIPGRVVSRYSHRLNSLLSDSCTETQTHTNTCTNAHPQVRHRSITTIKCSSMSSTGAEKHGCSSGCKHCWIKVPQQGSSARNRRATHPKHWPGHKY